MSAGLFEAFFAKEKPGQDAALVYLKLLLTYRRQGTNQPWATNGYLTSGLHMGMDRVKDAKALLHEMGLIEYIQRRESSGKMAKHYTKLNLVSNPGTVGVKPTSGKYGRIDRWSERPSSGGPHQRCQTTSA